MTKDAVTLPIALAARPLRVLRPVDASDIYAHPRAEIARLVERGALHRLAPGYYVLIPAQHLADRRFGAGWLPALEAAGWGVAAADYGTERVALMGLSAARLHGALPRALSEVTVAVPKQRPLLRLADRDAVVRFVTRDVTRLDVERRTTEVGDAWVTTAEQTLLDLAGRHGKGDPSDIRTALRALLSGADRPLLDTLATEQHRRPTLRRLLAALRSEESGSEQSPGPADA